MCHFRGLTDTAAGLCDIVQHGTRLHGYVYRVSGGCLAVWVTALASRQRSTGGSRQRASTPGRSGCTGDEGECLLSLA